MILAAVAAVYFAVVAPAAAGEEATTWRAGDLVFYGGGCHDPESMIAIAQSDNRDELWAVFAQAGKCFALRRRIPARLEAWLGGPFDHQLYPPVSVWRVFDVAEDTEFIWLDDTSGRHPARREMAL